MAIEGSSRKHVIVIYDDLREARDEQCRITPAALTAWKGDGVEFWNTGSEKITVKFDGGSPFNEDNFEMVKGERKQMTHVELKPGSYPYEATCVVSRKKAKGSRPIIIIYD